MAMTQGTVTVSDGGSVSGGGLARSIYDQQEATNITPFASSLPESAVVKAKKALAKYANDLAAGIVPYVQANAKTRVKTTDDKLQQVGAVDTNGPSADRLLSIE